jgi:ribosomal protein L10
LGKNKIVQLALGKSSEDEYQDNLSNVSELLSGNVGLLATNRPKADILKYALRTFFFEFLVAMCVCVFMNKTEN